MNCTRCTPILHRHRISSPPKSITLNSRLNRLCPLIWSPSWRANRLMNQKFRCTVASHGVRYGCTIIQFAILDNLPFWSRGVMMCFWMGTLRNFLSLVHLLVLHQMSLVAVNLLMSPRPKILTCTRSDLFSFLFLFYAVVRGRVFFFFFYFFLFFFMLFLKSENRKYVQ